MVDESCNKIWKMEPQFIDREPCEPGGTATKLLPATTTSTGPVPLLLGSLDKSVSPETKTSSQELSPAVSAEKCIACTEYDGFAISRPLADMVAS